MAAYNKVNGIDMCGDNPLIKTTLKQEWAYDGTVLCDFGGIKDITEATMGGIDLQMPHEIISRKELKKAIEQGALNESFLDERCKRILKLVFRVNDLAERSPETEFSFEQHHSVALEAAEESIVLLKNENGLLPLAAEETPRIAIIGRLAKEPLYQGTGCAIVHAKKVDIPFDAIQERCQGICQIDYAEGYAADGSTDDELLSRAIIAAEHADAVIAFIGAPLPGEDDDYNRKDMEFPAGHSALIKTLAQHNPRTICVFSSGDAVCLPWHAGIPAILATWYSGEAMGTALCRVLFGDTCPSGKLSVTMPERESDTPAYLSFGNSEFDMEYGEGIFVGYRYYDKKHLSPLYPFGYGLSYTSFAYSDLSTSVNEDAGILSIDITVKNTGKCRGKEIVQVYTSERAPRLIRPVRELKDFEKVDLLPEQEIRLHFEVPVCQLGYYDPTLDAWTVDNGIYGVEVGASSRDIRQSALICLEKQKRPEAQLKSDCGFYELLSHTGGKEHLQKFLIENQLLTKEQLSDKIGEKLASSFWSIRSYFDSKSDILSYEKINDLIAAVNAEQSAQTSSC